MRRRPLLTAISIIALTGFAALTATPASAQPGDYRARQTALTALSGVFGELHHIRRQCGARGERDLWRERMKSLVSLEDPSATQREAMVAAFNDAYRRAQKRFPECSRAADARAAERAAEGERLVDALAAPLRVSEEAGETTLWRGAAPR